MPSADFCARTADLSTAAPGVAAGPGAQISLSKDVNSPCATGPFTSGAEHRGLRCVVPACPLRQPYMVFLFVGSSGLTEASFPRNLAIPQLLRSNAWAILPPMIGGPDNRVPAQGTFTPSVHAHVRRTPVVSGNAGITARFPGGATAPAAAHSAVRSACPTTRQVGSIGFERRVATAPRRKRSPLAHSMDTDRKDRGFRG